MYRCPVFICSWLFLLNCYCFLMILWQKWWKKTVQSFYYTLTCDSKLQSLQKQHMIYVSRYVSYCDDHIKIRIVSWKSVSLHPYSNLTFLATGFVPSTGGQICVPCSTTRVTGNVDWALWQYRKISNISSTKSQNLYDSHLVLRSSLPNPLKPGVKSRMKM